jgi:hypothetical protein
MLKNHMDPNFKSLCSMDSMVKIRPKSQNTRMP